MQRRTFSPNPQVDVASDQRQHSLSSRRVPNSYSLDEAQRSVVRHGATTQPTIFLQGDAQDSEIGKGQMSKRSRQKAKHEAKSLMHRIAQAYNANTRIRLTVHLDGKVVARIPEATLQSVLHNAMDNTTEIHITVTQLAVQGG